MAQILVIDPNEAFATLLSDELRRLRHRVTIAASGKEAIQEARRRQPDLALLDLAVNNPGPIETARELRQLYPTLRLMLTHFMGEQAPASPAPLMQGSLPKPFFLPDLPGQIENALNAPIAGAGLVPEVPAEPAAAEAGPPPDDLLSFLQQAAQPAADTPPADDLLNFLQQAAQQAPVEIIELNEAAAPAAAPETPSPVAPQETVAPTPAPAPALAQVPTAPPGETVPQVHYDRSTLAHHRREVERLMDRLGQEIGADVVILTLETALAAWTGTLNQEAAEIVATAVWQGQHSARTIANLLGATEERFEQSISGTDYTLYALSINERAILAVAIRGNATLGLVRHRVRRATEDIAGLLG
ncbi:MAG: response regulator [Halothiobacillaceae bacterium]